MKRFLASSCLAMLAVASTAAAAQDADIPREVIDAFITGGSVVTSGESSGGECQPTSDEEYMRTGQETICGERNTVVFLGGNTARPTPAPAPAARRPASTPTPAPAATPRRPVTPAAPARPRPIAIPERCAPSQSEALNMCLTFGLGSAELTDRARSQIRVFAESMLANQSTERFLIAGHTDTSGTETRNCSLSQARAESVVAFMVGLGVAASQLQAVGYGQLNLQDGVPANDPRNRRVEIVRGSAGAGAGQACTS
jgi:outer membrane protein OmpA-like peptidoglycan-associated protein